MAMRRRGAVRGVFYQESNDDLSRAVDKIVLIKGFEAWERTTVTSESDASQSACMDYANSPKS
jgi:hypothetical protein